MLNGLVNLKRLNLSNNQIEVINDEAFIVPNLTDLDLSFNRIRNLGENSFKGLSKIEEINLSNNESEEVNVKFATKNLSTLCFLMKINSIGVLIKHFLFK
jgi:Leucine-rich repeat (LRR) protein